VAATHEEAFLEDIVAHPEDDAPRLIYADWLDDHGQPDRAEFIRLQVRQARAGDDPKHALARQDELLARHEGTWRSELPKLQGVTWDEHFSRGFVESAFVESVEVFLAQAEAMFAAAPVRSLRIGRIDTFGARALARAPHLARLLELNLGNNPGLGRAGVAYLAGSPFLEHLTALLLHCSSLGDEAVVCLAGSPHLDGLRELYLSGNEVGDDGTVALGWSGNLAGLTDLDLRDNQVGDVGARALAQDGQHERLETLWLVNNQVGADGAKGLAYAALPRLARLYINYNPIGDEGAAAFAASPHRAALRELDLRHCGIGDAGARALAESPHLDGIDMLWLTGNRIGLDALTLLRHRFGARVRF
jgi:uncharacterized protein (TIGR02996 family)